MVLPHTLNLQAIDLCNSRCIMCNIWKDGRKETLTIDKLRIELSHPFYREVRHVGVTGGEPTLRKDLFELYEIFIQILPRLTGASFITHGMQTERTVEVYSKINGLYRSRNLTFNGMVSIDGVGPVHDRVRGRSGAFDAATKTLLQLKANGIGTIAACTIVRSNVYELHDLLDWGKNNQIYVRFRVAEFIRRLYNDSCAQEVRSFNNRELRHLVCFFHLLLADYETEDTIRRTYTSILSILTGGERRIGCPNQKGSAVNVDSRAWLAVCAPKSDAFAVANDTKIIDSTLKSQRKQITEEHCANCIHDYHDDWTTVAAGEIALSEKLSRQIYNLGNDLLTTPEKANQELVLIGMQEILLTGWYGTETAGDIAILKGIIIEYLEANPKLRFQVASFYPYYTHTTIEQWPKNLRDIVRVIDLNSELLWSAIQNCDAIVMAGGPLMDIGETWKILCLFKHFSDLNKPCVIEGCGIGPLNKPEFRWNVTRIARFATQISVRDQASRDNLRLYGIRKPISVRIDPAITYLRSLGIRHHGSGSKTIRCFLRELTCEYPQAISPKQATRHLETFLCNVLAWYPDHRVELWAMHHFHIGMDDRLFAKELVRRIGNSRLVCDWEPRTPDEILEAMATAEFSICMRFHSCVFATEVATPFMAIDYTAGGKIRAFFDDRRQLDRLCTLSDLPNLTKQDLESKLCLPAINLKKSHPTITAESYRRQRIVHLIQNLIGGGSSRAMISLAKYSSLLSNFEHQIVSLAAANETGLKLAHDANLPVLNQPSRSQLETVLAEADVVLVHWWNNVDIAKLFRLELPPMRLALWLHVGGFHSPQVLIPELIDFSDLAVACSPYTYTHPVFCQLPADVLEHRTAMILAGAEFERLRGFEPRAHKNFQIGYIGTLDPMKMHSEFVDMSCAVNIPQAAFVVCGGGDYSWLSNRADELGQRHRFNFRGHVEDIQSVLATMDVYGYPLCFDTYAAAELNLQEVMFAGIPVVAFPHGGIGKLIIHNETGILVNTPEEYSSAIEALYRNPAERARIGANAAAFARTNWGAENSAHEFNAQFLKLLSQPKRLRQWGVPNDDRFENAPPSMADRVPQIAIYVGSRLLLESLGMGNHPFIESLISEDVDEILAAEDRIANLPQAVHKGAIITYRDAYPTDPYLQLWYGLGQLCHGRADDAFGAFTSAWENGFRHWRIQWYRALAAQRCNQVSTALAALKILLSESPDFIPARQLFNKLSGVVSSDPQSLQRELQPEQSAQRFLILANRFYKGGQLAQARDCLARALDLMPGQPDWLEACVDIDCQTGKFDSARTAYNALMVSDPGRRSPRLDKIRVLLNPTVSQSGYSSETVEISTMVQAARYAVLHDDIGAAIAALQGVRRAYPSDAKVLLALGYLQSISGSLATARETLTQAVAISPKNLLARVHLARVAVQLDSVHEFENAVQYVLQTDSEYPPAHRLLGDLMRDTNEPEQAIKHYRIALKHSKPDTAILHRLGHSLQLCGQTSESSICQKEANKLAKTESIHHESLGLLEAITETQNITSSSPHYDNFELIDPQSPDLGTSPLFNEYERVDCPTCNSNTAATVRTGADIVQCQACQTVFLRTRITRNAMRDLYQNYAKERSHLALPKSLSEAEQSGLKRDYFIKEILEFVEPSGSFLDVGCGWGAFLLNARNKGFSPRGIEINKRCMNYANSELRIPVTDVQLEDYEIAPESLRVATMNHVFDHLPDPRAALNKIFTALEDGGMFCGIVPNFNSICSETLGENWYWLDSNYHYQHFTPATLRIILEQSGFVVEKIYTATGDYGVEAVRKVFQRRDTRCTNEDFFQSELAHQEKNGRGEEIRFFARKRHLHRDFNEGVDRNIESKKSPEITQVFKSDEISGKGVADPIVSAIVSTYASERFISACLENLSKQTIFERIEVIVVDSGSPENERAIVEEFQNKFKNIRYLRTPRETLYAAWNRALGLARGRYFANVNTDDSLRNDALEILVASLEKHSDCAYSYADCAWTTKPNDTFPSNHIVKTVKYPDYAPVETLFYCITGCIQFFRTAILRNVGGFDASLKYAGDYEMTLRMMAAKHKAVHVPDVLSLFFQNATGLTQASNRAAQEHEMVMFRYRDNLDVGNIFEFNSQDRVAKANAFALLGCHSTKITIPWELETHAHNDFAFACFRAALELDPESRAAGMGYLALSQKLGRLDSVIPEILRRWPSAKTWIDLFRAGERLQIPTLRHAVLGPVYRDANHIHRPTSEQLACEPNELQPWIVRIDGRYVYLSEDLFPRPTGLNFDQKELRDTGNRLTNLLADLPPFYAHFGGAGDALVLLASFYDQRPNAIVFSHPNSIGAARALFEAFPKLSRIYFLPQHTEPFFHAVLRYAVHELTNCLGAGATPRFGYDEEWKASLDITKEYRINLAPSWAEEFRQNLNSCRVAVAPKGSQMGMVGSKRNIILPEQWQNVIAHIQERGFEPVILGTPSEAKDYPALDGCVDAREESFSGQMKLIGECVGLVGADSWAKSFSALAEIPTIVFEPLKGPDLCAWKDPSDWVFIEPWKSIKMVRTLEQFRCAFDACIAKLPGLETSLEPIFVWEGSFLDYGSLSHINRELTSRLSDVICVSSTVLRDHAENDASLQHSARKLSGTTPMDVSVTVRHQWPPDWSAPASGQLVVIQPWEYGHLPQAWVEQSSNVDEFWVPTPLVRHMYVDSGIEPEKVRVMPNGVNSKKFHPSVRPLKLPTKKRFRFLFVGGTIHRKGPDVLLEAFAAAFTAADDVCLVIKDFGGDSFYRGQTAEAAIEAFEKKLNAPEILYLKQELSSDQMPSLYTACTCLVLPYRGEGFGMPVLEAMSCGLPVIVTAGGATDSFVSTECGWKIPAERVRLNGKIGDIVLAKSGWLLEPSKGHLILAMRFAAANPEDCRRRGTAGRGVVERKFDWNDIAAAVSHRLRELVVRPPVKWLATAPLKSYVLPGVAKVGRLDEARESLTQRNYEAAWTSGVEAIEQRPFHPEGWVFLSEVAKATGNRSLARRCAQKAVAMTPRCKLARQAVESICEGSDEPTLDLAAPPFRDGAPPRLTVCLITRNEERFIDACLKSVQGLANQIVLVDTGSADRTVEIARSHGAEVHFRGWDDDFSAARNEALTHARGDWVLILDADEEVATAHHETLRALLGRPNVIGYRLPLVEVGREAGGVTHVPRLFRNAPRQFFVGRIHEQVSASLEINRETWSMVNLFGDAQLIHHGYIDEVMKSRDTVLRNLRLLELANEEQPNDVNLLMNLGLELWRSGETVKGLGSYRKAYRVMLARSAAETTPELREVLLTQYASHLTTLKRFDEIAALFTERAIPGSQRTASHWYLLGVAQFALKHWDACVESLSQCLALRHQAALTPIHSNIHKAMPSLCLAHSLQQLGRRPEAIKAYEQALQDEPEAESARVDYATFLTEQGQIVPALTVLHQGVQHDPRQTRVWEAGGRLALRQRETLEFALDWTDEAVRTLPDEPSLRRQRAETLLLHGQVHEAITLWGNTSPDADAAGTCGKMLCQLLAGLPVAGLPAEQERAVSDDLIRRYRQAIHLGLADWVRSLHEHVRVLRPVLPSAARLIEQVLAESDRKP